jgi:hypothetical protein
MVSMSHYPPKPMYFPMPRPLNSCAECGARVLDANGQTLEEQDLGYRRVHFDLSDDTRAFVSFCPHCATHDWTPARLYALERQCKHGWRHMQTPGLKPNWSGDELTFKPSIRPMQTWAEVQ